MKHLGREAHSRVPPPCCWRARSGNWKLENPNPLASREESTYKSSAGRGIGQHTQGIRCVPPARHYEVTHTPAPAWPAERSSVHSPPPIRGATMTMIVTTIKSRAFAILYYYLAIVAGISVNLWNLSFIEASDISTLERGEESIRRTVRIINDSGRTVELYWMNSKDGDIPDGNSNGGKLMSTIWHGGTGITIESFVGDVFEIRQRKANSPSPAATTEENEQESSCEEEEEQRKEVATLTVQEDEVAEQSKFTCTLVAELASNPPSILLSACLSAF